MTEDLEDWAKKCMSCIHCYKKKDDADYLYCRLKNGCRYETTAGKNLSGYGDRYEILF